MEHLSQNSNAESILIVGYDGYIRQVIATALGYAPSEIIGMPLSYFVVPQALETALNQWQNFHQHQPNSSNTSLELYTTATHKDGRSIPVYAKFTPLADRNEFLLIVRNYQEQIRQHERLQIINDIALAISQLDVEQIISVLYERISELMETKHFFMGLYDEQTQCITLRHVYDGDERLPDYTISLSKQSSLSRWVIENRQKLVIQDIEHDYLPVPSENYGTRTKSGVFIPLVVYDQVVGIMSVQSQKTNAFTDEDVAMLESLASPTALAIYNARLYNNLQRQLYQVKALHQLAERITVADDPEKITKVVVATLTDIFEAHFSFIALKKEAEENFHITTSSNERSFEVSLQIITQFLELKTAQIFNQQEISELFDSRTHSLIAAPLISRQSHLGVLVVGSTHPLAFENTHLQLIEIVAAQTAAVLENWHLLMSARATAEKLSAAYHELKELDQLRQELVDNVSHELRSPLSYIRAYVGLMAVGELGEITREQAEALKIIDRKTDNMLRLINDILEVEKIRPETLQRDIEDITKIVQQVHQSAQIAYMTRNVAIVLNIEDKPPEMNIDTLRIEQVLQNLISNAVKFSPDGGTVTITMIRKDNYACISVSDQGEGIPEDKLKRIFERFYRVPGISQEGIGIGLSIVKQIVEAHGGYVTVESTVGKGTTFSVFLPI